MDSESCSKTYNEEDSRGLLLATWIVEPIRILYIRSMKIYAGAFYTYYEYCCMVEVLRDRIVCPSQLLVQIRTSAWPGKYRFR